MTRRNTISHGTAKVLFVVLRKDGEQIQSKKNYPNDNTYAMMRDEILMKRQ